MFGLLRCQHALIASGCAALACRAWRAGRHALAPAAGKQAPLPTRQRTRVDAQAREVARHILQLVPKRLHVVCVHVGVTQHVHKVPGLEAAHLRGGEVGRGGGLMPV